MVHVWRRDGLSSQDLGDGDDDDELTCIREDSLGTFIKSRGAARSLRTKAQPKPDGADIRLTDEH